MKKINNITELDLKMKWLHNPKTSNWKTFISIRHFTRKKGSKQLLPLFQFPTLLYTLISQRGKKAKKKVLDKMTPRRLTKFESYTTICWNSVKPRILYSEFKKSHFLVLYCKICTLTYKDYKKSPFELAGKLKNNINGESRFWSKVQLWSFVNVSSWPTKTVYDNVLIM